MCGWPVASPLGICGRGTYRPQKRKASGMMRPSAAVATSVVGKYAAPHWPRPMKK
jgi:hypothetical protein